VARSVPARLDVGDCDSAPGLLVGRFRASTITCCTGTGRTERPLRPRSHGCRLARRSGHLVPAGTRAAPYRPDQQRRRVSPAWLVTQAERKPPSGRPRGRPSTAGSTNSGHVFVADPVAAFVRRQSRAAPALAYGSLPLCINSDHVDRSRGVTPLGRRRSRGGAGADDPDRGFAKARPEWAREPKQSCRAHAAHASGPARAVTRRRVSSLLLRWSGGQAERLLTAGCGGVSEQIALSGRCRSASRQTRTCLEHLSNSAVSV